ncbi:MAG: hypothetical protein WB441_00060 [Nocardioidaceae bacterium]
MTWPDHEEFLEPLTGSAVGMVPVESRGSLPFALLHGESLVAVASWALGEAGVELLNFNESWRDVLARGAALVLHDPLCPGTPVDFLARATRTAVERSVVVVGVRPVTDTVRRGDDAAPAPGVGVIGLGEVEDRDGLVTVCSPVVLPHEVLARMATRPLTDDLPLLVSQLRRRYDVLLLEAPPTAMRVADESDVRLLESGAGD